MSIRVVLRHRPTGKQLHIAKLWADGTVDWIGADPDLAKEMIAAVDAWIEANDALPTIERDQIAIRDQWEIIVG